MTPTSTDGGKGGSIHAYGVAAALALLILIGLLLIGGDRIRPRVLDFDCGGAEVEAGQKQQLRFTFSRPMDHGSVESGFTIIPPEEGSFSWTGRTLVFTPKIAYIPDCEYWVEIVSGEDVFGKQVMPYESTFITGKNL
ncbi:MAG: Ig-like domain-containing protein [Actinobacteria bacterium]|nr:Ig-like domain-containing protein [Actinomycetota bacterium]MBU4240866.1 Ig-like domain-containing protein [Actinomycetota bacterium]MBU4301135.1 Ig-like domain-containing protein [Actinomycetota bacterium]MBU4386084.1 Ig-like domain-containing protein [Actinomycetota bacterium]MBU4490090.1 Ig-like domain-containing protein [Actinomycetota bacterium]